MTEAGAPGCDNQHMSTRFTEISHFVQRPRLLGAVLMMALLFVPLSSVLPIARSLLLAFDGGALVFLGLMGSMMLRATPQSMRHRAQLQGEGHWVVFLVSLLVAGVVIGALFSELRAAQSKSLADIALASVSILLSWLFVAVLFTQQYAQNFYARDGQLLFPGTAQPDYSDFLYFAIVLSMCCQTSDVSVTASPMRRLVILHGLISFFFNVIIIAITVNVVASVA